MHLSLEESEEFGPQMYLKWWSATGLTASVFLIELDRFLAIRFPLKYPFFITCERSLGTCAVTVLNYISFFENHPEIKMFHLNFGIFHINIDISGNTV